MPRLIESLKNLIVSNDFCEKYKKGPKAFTRDRLLPFHRLIYLLLNMNNNSYQDELDTGEIEILITSLTDMDVFPKELFSDLYHLRWPVEEDYKTLKYRIQIENFSGKTVHSVYQDFHAKVLSKNLTAVIATTTRDEIIRKSEGLKYNHQINFAQALSKMKDTILLIFNCSWEHVTSYVEQIRTIFIKTTESIRPGRNYPRKHRVKQKRFFLEYKTTC